MKSIVTCLLVVSTLTSIYSQPVNVLISSSNDPNEPSICINPYNVNEIIGGTNLANLYRSTDGGLTWKEEVLTSSFGVWGDPVIACDTAEVFYFFHLSNPPFGNWIDRIVCQKSSDKGQNWNDGSFAGLNGTKAQDKEWVCIDRNTNEIHMTWTQFDKYGVPDDTLYSNILYSKSNDQGDSWLTPIQINDVSGDCVDSDSTTEGAVPAVGPSGEVYVSWAGPVGLVFDKSTDGGQTWGTDIFIDSMPGGWEYTIPGISRCNGLPITTCDLSGGKNHGTIYVNWSDQRNGTDDTDIWLSKSIDGGQTWTKPARINDDNTQTHQFLTWMTIDQSTGYLYFIWYDRRNYNDHTTDVYMAVSYDGGETFINGILSENPFKPSAFKFFGDYTNISAVDGQVRPIWTAMNNAKTEIYTALYTEQNVGIQYSENYNWFVDSYPNPTTSEINIPFRLESESKVELLLYDLNGKKVATVLKNKKYSAGDHVIAFEAADIGLSSGTYLYHLKTAEFEFRKRLIIQP